MVYTDYLLGNHVKIKDVSHIEAIIAGLYLTIFSLVIAHMMHFESANTGINIMVLLVTIKYFLIAYKTVIIHAKEGGFKKKNQRKVLEWG